MDIRFVIPGRVGGKGRPRFSTRGGKVRTFTDAKTQSTEAIIRHFASQAMGGNAPMQGPVALSINIFQAIPASWSNKKRAAAFYLTGRPDADNIAKSIADACNKIVYADDAQISDLAVTRRYTSDGAERVEIAIRVMESDWLTRRNAAKRQEAV